MTYLHDGFNWVLRFNKGELLVAGLTGFVKEQGIAGGWVSGIGGALWAELGFYQLHNKTYKWQKVDELLEVVSLQGVIAWKEGAPALHLHGVLSKQDLQTVGGHVKELAVGGTCEVFIHKWYADKLTRSHSDDIGLNLLDL